jgi:twitching motility protein PilT
MLGTPAIRNLIRENKVPQMVSVMQTSLREGMQTLDSDLQRLVKSRKITQQAALEKCQNKKLFGGGAI